MRRQSARGRRATQPRTGFALVLGQTREDRVDRRRVLVTRRRRVDACALDLEGLGDRAARLRDGRARRSPARERRDAGRRRKRVHRCRQRRAALAQCRVAKGGPAGRSTGSGDPCCRLVTVSGTRRAAAIRRPSPCSPPDCFAAGRAGAAGGRSAAASSGPIRAASWPASAPASRLERRASDRRLADRLVGVDGHRVDARRREGVAHDGEQHHDRPHRDEPAPPSGSPAVGCLVRSGVGGWRACGAARRDRRPPRRGPWPVRAA